MKWLLLLVAVVGFAAWANAGPMFPDSLDSDLDEPVRSDTADDNENINDHNDPDPEPPPEPDPEEEEPPPPDIFGEPIPGMRIIFILDRSCSMGWNPTYRWNRLKQEMLPAIDALEANNTLLKQQWQQGGQVGPEPKIEFDIIHYHSYVTGTFRGMLVEATTANCASAKSFINAVYPGCGTNWTAPLQAGYNTSTYPDLDTMYFMSDGYAYLSPSVPQAGRAAQKPEFHFVGQQVGGSYLQSTYVNLVNYNQPNATSSFIPD